MNITRVFKVYTAWFSADELLLKVAVAVPSSVQEVKFPSALLKKLTEEVGPSIGPVSGEAKVNVCVWLMTAARAA
jgi:hypothetical protein